MGTSPPILAELDLVRLRSQSAAAENAAFWDIVAAGNAPEDAELADVIDAMGNPDVVTLGQLIDAPSRNSLRPPIG